MLAQKFFSYEELTESLMKSVYRAERKQEELNYKNIDLKKQLQEQLSQQETNSDVEAESVRKKDGHKPLNQLESELLLKKIEEWLARQFSKLCV